jgi:hypothetical protein
MCASCARHLRVGYRLTVSRRSNTYECQMRSSIRSRINSRASLRRGEEAVVCRGVIVEAEAIEDTA